MIINIYPQDNILLYIPSQDSHPFPPELVVRPVSWSISLPSARECINNKEEKRMTQIKTIGIKGWTDRTTQKFDYTLELVADYDYLPMTEEQDKLLMIEANHIKGVLDNLLMTWKNAPTGEFKTAETTVPTKEQKPAEPNEPGLVLCSICKSSTEERISVRGVPYRYCPQCKDTRRLDGTPFPPKKK